LAFIPQFIDVESGYVFTQFLILGLITDLLNFAADWVVVIFAGSIS
jgi:threonine/homoserine/homoserine lactone efflux protein